MRQARASTELGHDFDLTDDGVVERAEIFRWNPVLLMLSPPCLLDLIAIQEALCHEEARNVSLAAGRYIPITSNFDRVVFTQHWIKDRLLRQPGRKGPHAGLPDQIELIRPDGAPQGYCFDLHVKVSPAA